MRRSAGTGGKRGKNIDPLDEDYKFEAVPTSLIQERNRPYELYSSSSRSDELRSVPMREGFERHSWFPYDSGEVFRPNQ